MSMLTSKALASLVEIGDDRLAQIEKGGWIKRSARDSWPAIETLSGLVRFYRNENRRGPKGEADARLKDARAQQIELKTRLLAHELVRADESIALVDAVIGKLMGHLASVPARCSRDLGMRRLIDSEINAARTAAADELEQQSKVLFATGKAAQRSSS